VVTLPQEDYRTVHAAKILALRNGDTVRCGIVSCAEHGGWITDEATIQWLPEGKVQKSKPLGKRDPPGALRVFLTAQQPPPNHADNTETPSVSLIWPSRDPCSSVACCP
jgi:hypothetical protein